MTEVVGIDHVYLAVSDLARSEEFYDRVFGALGFRKNTFPIDDERHVQYFNRHFGIVLRPARSGNPHDPYGPGLHHLCLRVDDADAVRAATEKLRGLGVSVTDPRVFPEYAPDYVAAFFADPDGIRLEITNYREERRRRHDRWNEL